MGYLLYRPNLAQKHFRKPANALMRALSKTQFPKNFLNYNTLK